MQFFHKPLNIFDFKRVTGNKVHKRFLFKHYFIEMSDNPEITVRVVFIGDTQVGKTSILAKYLNGSTPNHPEPTVGVSLVTKTIECENFNISLIYYDTAGQEKYRAIGTLYYKNADVAIVVYDVTNKESFESIRTWIQNFRDNATKDTVIIVGNKFDLKDQIQISNDDVEEAGRSFRAHCLYTSAIDGTGIEELFNTVNDLAVQAVTESFEQRRCEQESNVTFGSNPPQKKCC
ncbi:Ras-related protein RABA4b [Tritrichomonas foetus]|uniref:Ras-related protein RABA4b n=1 Tax=Tritrichomonas foetus TaxID=1144522 RepID=A0A1J4L580_9EUKA|nr:Ras-related protein RABA4b [Tritrichomonas foetus]|eukprot:OHT17148.1 Ras-related protein RABA4b [Tritrichomonas foetus]